MTPRRFLNNVTWLVKRIFWWFLSFIFFWKKKPSAQSLSISTVYIDNFVAVVEIKPCKRTIHTLEGFCHLSFPYIYFVVRFVESRPHRGSLYYTFSSLRMGFSEKQVTNSKGVVGKIPISNYHESDHEFNYCLGSSAPSGVYHSVQELLDSVVRIFWQSTFQMDIDKLWARFTKLGNDDYINRMINQRVPISSLMHKGIKNVEFKSPEPEPPKPEPPVERTLRAGEFTISIPSPSEPESSPSRTSTNNSKKTKRRKRKSSRRKA